MQIGHKLNTSTKAFNFTSSFSRWYKTAYMFFFSLLFGKIRALEKEILFNCPSHSDLGDCMNYMLRSRWTRMIYKGKEIPCRPCDKAYYTRVML